MYVKAQFLITISKNIKNLNNNLQKDIQLNLIYEILRTRFFPVSPFKAEQRKSFFPDILLGLVLWLYATLILKSTYCIVVLCTLYSARTCSLKKYSRMHAHTSSSVGKSKFESNLCRRIIFYNVFMTRFIV